MRRSNCAGALHYVPEITWILFLRILDELEEQEAKAVEDNYIWSLESPYRWRDWAAPQGTKRLELRFYKSGRFMEFVNGDLIPYLRNLKNQPAATPRQKIISEVLSSTHQVHIDTEFHLLDVLDKVHEISLQGIDDIHIFHISQIYEELLLKMGEKGNDGGQFFTPREVIRVMVEAINPQIEQTIYDPSCGTGGFLAQSYEYMRSALGDEITGDQLETLKYCTFYGREKENLIFPIALVNLMLHGIDQPNLWHGNTLTKDGIYADLFAGAPSLFDIILTNPPFGGKEHKEVQAQFTYKTSATKILFLQHVIDSLRPGGKCGIVLDEGVLSRTNETAFVKTKRKLLDDCDLWCIVSLPPGTFVAAGMGVKANILFFTRGKVTEKIWYYDLSDIKVTKRQPLTHNHFEDFLKLLPGRENSARSWTVSRAEIEAKNFDLKAVNPNAIVEEDTNLKFAEQSDKQWRRLEQEKKSLEKLYELQREKIDRLRKFFLIETDPLRKFQYEQQIQPEEIELQKLIDKLNEIEKQLDKTKWVDIEGLVQEVRKKIKLYYEKRHGTLKVLGMREPVKLESVYTAVQFLDDEGIRTFESIENLEKFYRQANKRKFQSQVQGKQEGIKVVNEQQYLMVLGGPGAGKSTFMRKMGLEALKGKIGGYKYVCIPVFIELKRFTSSEINIENVIAEELKICGFSEPNQFTAKALEQGKLLILLDSLDEVPTRNLINVINYIQDFVDKYDKNRFIISCRVAAYRHNFRRFTDVVMADFDDIQIENFIKNWFNRKSDMGKDCWEKLNSHEYTAAKELTQTPLLLTLVCLLYQRSGKIPTNRATLYERALRVLLEEWAGEKGIPQEDLYKGLDTKRKEMILSEIAHDAFQEDRLFLPQREIADTIEKLLAEMLPDEKFINGVDVLKSIELQHGILVERADSIYSFSHLTLQEYLTAQYIDDHRQIEKLVIEHLTDERWKEVFLLVAGLMRGGTDDLLLLMEKEAQKYINTPKLQALLNWAQQATTGSAGNFKPVGKRAAALALAYAVAFNKKAITISIAKAYAIARTYTISYAHAYADDVDIYAIAYADTDAYGIATSKAISISDSYVYAYTLSILNALSILNVIIRELEKLKIFNKVHFSLLIAQLEGLKIKSPDNKQPQEVGQTFFEGIQQIWLNAFNLIPETANLSKEEIEALKNYLYANHLIIQCKQASVRVSPTTWEAIEARMLLVPSNSIIECQA